MGLGTLTADLNASESCGNCCWRAPEQALQCHSLAGAPARWEELIMAMTGFTAIEESELRRLERCEDDLLRLAMSKIRAQMD